MLRESHRVDLAVLAIAFAMTAAAHGETRTIETDQNLVVLELPASDTALVDWEVRDPEDLEFATFRTSDGMSTAVLCVCGTSRIIVVGDVIDWDARTRSKVKWIITPKNPPDPTPPEPDPGPDPPPPDPTVPFPAPGLAVLVIYEAGEVGKLPASQQAIFSSNKLLRFLRSKTVKLSDGDPAIRVWDKDYKPEHMVNVPAVFREAYFDVRDEAAGQLPWIAISNGQRGWQGPLPQNVNDVMELVDGFAD